MLKVDLHSHSMFSLCGMHTYLEMLQAARDKGVEMLAITDHGEGIGGRLAGTFFNRFRNPVEGIKLLKGLECNVMDADGKTDFPEHLAKYLDIVLMGIHWNVMEEPDLTGMLLAAIERNPVVDIITHPNQEGTLVDFAPVAQAAKERGMALELNNSKILFSVADDKETERMLQTCKDMECFIAVNSDAHVVTEIGVDDHVQPYLQRVDFPEELIVNRTVESALAFLESRQKYREL